MRRIILFAGILFSTFIGYAQLSTPTGISDIKITNKDTVQVFMFNGLANAEVDYNGSTSGIKWYQYQYADSISKYTVGTSPFYQLENNTGYILEEANGHRLYFWIIDYNSNLPVYRSFEPENNPGAQCKDVTLLIDATIPVMSYKTFKGDVHELSREFNIKYQTKIWDGSKWEPKDTLIQSVFLPACQKSVPAPFMDTYFKLYGDQYATALNIKPDTISSSFYITNAIANKLETKVANREHEQNNEGNAPSDKTPINFSAPIDVQFLSHANEPTARFYNWSIYKDDKLIVNRTDKDHRYTFTEFGTYKVKLVVSNSVCSVTDSLTVIVTESELYVPNVFTPNGDSFNDEFRVAYKSLISFQCWVFNRWGRQVFHWSDPTKGWDGNINGKKASPGPYFYVIKATGSDKKKYKLSGDINLLRGAGY